MKYRKLIILLLGVLTFSSCIFDSGTDRITGKYYVLWMDVSANQTIAEQTEQSTSSFVGLVPEYVFAVGHNDKYIIAKQHPTSGFENGYAVDTAITNYYIINTASEAKEKVLGPLTADEFKQMKKLCGIENMDFDMNYPEIP